MKNNYYYIDMYGRVRPVEKGCFLKEYYRQQIEFYNRKLRECEGDICGDSKWRRDTDDYL